MKQHRTLSEKTAAAPEQAAGEIPVETVPNQPTGPAAGVRDKARLTALRATGLLDSAPEHAFDRLTELVRKLLGVPVSLVSLVDADRQFFKSSPGLPEPWATLRETPLSHSFCQHVVASQEALVISDAREHPLVCDNLAIRDLNVIAYLGVPLLAPTGHVIGSLCAIGSEPRMWTDDHVAVIHELAALVMTEIDLQHQLRERLQAEQALKNINQELNEFAYIVSHDLKAPLRAIGSLATWLHSDYTDQLDEDGREQLDLLVGRVKRMHGLIEGILQYSRAGRAKEEKMEVDLNALVGGVIEMLAPPPHIHIALESELPTLFCEPTRIAQVFQNLLSNAIKYLDKPRGEIRVACAPDGAFWQFSIADNGPGIESAYFVKIFQLFQTLAPRDDVEGTGVGLSIIKKIVEMNSGRIWLESEVGSGTTFYFTLPRV